MRRLARGRISEISGPSTIPLDTFFKNLGLYRTAEATWANGVDPTLHDALVAYSDGVNDYVSGISLIIDSH